MAADRVIAEAETVLPLGGLPPDEVHTPGPFVDHVVALRRTERGVCCCPTLGPEWSPAPRARSPRAWWSISASACRPRWSTICAADFPVCLHTENGLSGIGPTLPPERRRPQPDRRRRRLCLDGARHRLLRQRRLLRPGALRAARPDACWAPSRWPAMAIWPTGRSPASSRPAPAAASSWRRRRGGWCVLTTHARPHGRPEAQQALHPAADRAGLRRRGSSPTWR